MALNFALYLTLPLIIYVALYFLLLKLQKIKIDNWQDVFFINESPAEAHTTAKQWIVFAVAMVGTTLFAAYFSSL